MFQHNGREFTEEKIWSQRGKGESGIWDRLPSYDRNIDIAESRLLRERDRPTKMPVHTERTTLDD